MSRKKVNSGLFLFGHVGISINFKDILAHVIQYSGYLSKYTKLEVGAFWYFFKIENKVEISSDSVVVCVYSAVLGILLLA